jgi:hypothetical protein
MKELAEVNTNLRSSAPEQPGLAAGMCGRVAARRSPPNRVRSKGVYPWQEAPAVGPATAWNQRWPQGWTKGSAADVPADAGTGVDSAN